MKRFLAAAAIAPLCFAAVGARAETQITSGVSTPVVSSKANNGSPDDVHITTAGSVTPSGGVAVTMDSSNSLNNEGVIRIQNVDNATGVLVNGGNTGSVTTSGTIEVDDTKGYSDSNGDGINDGPWANQTNLFGIRVVGPGVMNGSITQSTGSIIVKGNNSAGISIETGLNGSVSLAGSTTVSGDNSFGVHATGPISGSVALSSSGTIVASGTNVVGLALDGPVAGALTIGGTVTATGYRLTSRPVDTIIAKMTPDELLQGGPAVRIQSDVLGGILLNATAAVTDSSGNITTAATTGIITSYGSAPALIIGGANASHIGLASTGDDAFGLLVRGNINGLGVYDGFAAQGVVIGGQGGTVQMDGGVKITGIVNSTSYQANSTALHIGSGATVPTVRVDGSLTSSLTASGAAESRALQIDAGAQVSTLINNGVLTASTIGPAANATAVVDAAGSLTLIQNTKTIAAVITPSSTTDVITGKTVALDLSANTQGVTVQQLANSSSTVIPAIIGDVKFGSGPSVLDLQAGTLVGAVSFGSGADSLSLSGGASMKGALTDAGGGLNINVAQGTLNMTNAAVLNLGTLNIGSGSTVIFTADPANNQSGKFIVSGAATIGTGAKIGLNFASKLTSPATYTVIQAGSLTSGTLDQSLIGSTPWFYTANITSNDAAGTVDINVRQRTAAEAGLTGARAAAYGAIFDAFDRDAGVTSAMLSKTDAASFGRLYNQFLPDYTGGPFQALAQGTRAVMRAQAEEPQGLKTDENRAWVQEITFAAHRNTSSAGDPGYDVNGFGFAGGIESADTAVGTLGATVAFMTSDIDEQSQLPDASLNGSTLQAGVYWRQTRGGFLFDASLMGGFAWFKSDRFLIDYDASGNQTLRREAKSDWVGGLAAARFGVSYKADFGRYYVRPGALIDYVMLYEGSHDETGGGDAMNLKVDARTNQELAAEATIAFGARFGGPDLRWGPEVQVGYREILTGDPADTTARFASGGNAFTLSPSGYDKGGLLLRAALRGGGAYAYFAVEASGEIRNDYQNYEGRFVARFLF